MHERLLINHMRLIRHLSESDTCPRCHSTREDMHHLLINCPKAKVLWVNLRNLPWWQQSQHTTLQDWIRINLKSKDLINDIQWPTVFLTTLWTTWKERNKQVFENITQPPHTSVNFILNKALESQAAFQVFLHPNFKEPSLMS